MYDVDAFVQAGQRPHTSPAEEVIMDLITLGMTVDSLYRILHTMDARQCMETLAEYGENFNKVVIVDHAWVVAKVNDVFR